MKFNSILKIKTGMIFKYKIGIYLLILFSNHCAIAQKKSETKRFFKIILLFDNQNNEFDHLYSKKIHYI